MDYVEVIGLGLCAHRPRRRLDRLTFASELWTSPIPKLVLLVDGLDENGQSIVRTRVPAQRVGIHALLAGPRLNLQKDKR